MEPSDNTYNSSNTTTPNSAPAESNLSSASNSTPPEPTLSSTKPNSFSPTTSTPITESNAIALDSTTHPQNNLRPFIIILSILAFVIIALTITIIILNNQSSPNESTAETTVTNPEGLKMNEDFQARLSSLTEEATKLLDEDPQNADKVQEIFTNVISEYQDPVMFDYVRRLIDTEAKLLLQYNLIEKTFEVYNLADIYIPTNQSVQNDFFYEALTLAKQEQNQPWIDIFQAKFDATIAAKQAELDATVQANIEYEKRIQQIIEQNNNAAKQLNQTEEE